MPPRPRSATTRYRPTSSVPGRKRPSSSELDELGVLLEGGVDAGALTAVVRVTIVSAASDAPHRGQKRLFSGMLSPQDRHASILFVQCSTSSGRLRISQPAPNRALLARRLGAVCRVEILDPAGHHFFFALVTPANGQRRIGVGGIVRTVVVMRGDDQLAALLHAHRLLQPV